MKTLKFIIVIGILALGACKSDMTGFYGEYILDKSNLDKDKLYSDLIRDNPMMVFILSDSSSSEDILDILPQKIKLSTDSISIKNDEEIMTMRYNAINTNKDFKIIVFSKESRKDSLILGNDGITWNGFFYKKIINGKKKRESNERRKTESFVTQ